MNFTREPIIETVISPREGSKLLIRNSKEGSREEYLVEAVEVVSFGNGIFFRSTEWPRSFLVPVSDYEVIEEKEARMVLKNVPIEKSIKITGSKDTGRPQPREEEKTVSEEGQDRNMDKRRDRGRRSRQQKQRMDNRPMEKKVEMPMPVEESVAPASSVEVPREEKKEPEEAKVSPSVIRKLFPPPPTLINEKFKRPENKEVLKEEEKPFEKPIEPLDGEGKKEETPGDEPV